MGGEKREADWLNLSAGSVCSDAEWFWWVKTYCRKTFVYRWAFRIGVGLSEALIVQGPIGKVLGYLETLELGKGGLGMNFMIAVGVRR